MAFIWRSTRLQYNLIGFTRQAGDLIGRKNKFVFAKCQKINFNKLGVRAFALSEKIKEQDKLNTIANFENEIYQLNLDIERKRVLKENAQKVLEGLKQNGQMTNSQVLLLLRCCTNISIMCSEKERIQMAEDIFNTAADLGIKFNDSLYNALLIVFVQNNHEFSLKNFLNNMEETGVEPSLVTYKHLLRASCQQGDIKSAKEFLKQMKNLNYSLNVYDFNSLILVHSKIGDFESVHEIFKIMKGKGIEPTTQSYVYLLCGYIEKGNIEKFEEIFNNLSDNNISLSDSDLLEVVYTLAVKKQDDHIEMVLNKISKNYSFDKLLTNFIPRLLHKKLDSVALKLLETVNFQDRPFNHGLSVSRNILDHFIHYRSPEEILNMCEKLETRGYAKAAVTYCLKKVFLLKDEYFALSLLSEINARLLPVRVHYFWPIILKASKNGNEKMLSVLKKLPNTLINRTDMAFNVILPNYKFSESRTADFEKLSQSGMNYDNIARYILNHLLKQNQIDEIDELVANYPIRVFKLEYVFKNLFKCLATQPDKVEVVVNILYNLHHDIYLSSSREAEPDMGAPEHHKYYDNVITSLLNVLQDHEIILRLLEVMLEKKISISSGTGSLIIKSLPNKNVDELVSKLSDPNLKIEINESLLNRKQNLIKNNSGKKLLQDQTSKDPLSNCLLSMLRLAELKGFEKAIEFGQDFAQQKKESIKKDSISQISKDIFKNFLNKVSMVNEVMLKEKALALGKTLGVLTNDSKDDMLLYMSHLKSSNIITAFEKFKKNLLFTGKNFMGEELLMKCFSAGNTELVQSVTELITETKGKNFALSSLVIALAATGEVDKTKKLLSTAKFVFRKDQLLRKCEIWYNSENLEIFENMANVFKNLNRFDDILTLLYKILVKKYAKKNQIDKIHQLRLEIQNNNTDQEFVNQLLKFQENLDVIQLSDSISINFTMENQPQKNLNHSFSNLTIETNDFHEEYLSCAMNKNLSYKVALNSAVKLAFDGNVEQACSIAEIYFFTRKNLRKIAAAFLKSEKVNEYFEFLDFFASKGDFTIISDCFRIGCLIPALKKNDEQFKKYKSLSLQCADETHFSMPVISCFVTCVKLPGKLADAEEIFDKYSNYFKTIPFSQIREAVDMTELSSDFYENILSSKKLKDHFSDHIHLFYNRLITLKCEENKLSSALDYVGLAIRDSVEKLLDKNSLKLLKTKLEKQGKIFPYPELNY